MTIYVEVIFFLNFLHSFSYTAVFYKVLIYNVWRIHLVSPPMFWDILLQIRRRGQLKEKYNQKNIKMELKHGTFCPHI